MPLGWERINARTSQPNKNIVFIKPLPGPDSNTSKDFLERIAAQCVPVMNKHHLAVASLEEYEPNLEFWGRNFNNGEVIQLVLKSPSTGRWLPFKFVQMIMMHELAHNIQMNHSKAFWAVRNEFSAEMKALWDKGYTGDGLWGRGVLLENGNFAREELDADEVLPEHMCGGTFKSRGKKRKAKPKITHKERQERRIKKKFGTNGVTLGADDETKVRLEKGKRLAGKPRVAGSARGRELRAAAALARFEVKKEETQMSDVDLVTDSETDSDTDDPTMKVEPDDAIDINGQRLLDNRGGGMVRVCGEEDNDEDDVKRELLDLQQFSSLKAPPSLKPAPRKLPETQNRFAAPLVPPEKNATKAIPGGTSTKSMRPVPIIEPHREEGISHADKPIAGEKPKASISELEMTSTVARACPVCSVENEPIALTCMVCSNVLKPEFVPNAWSCTSSTCKDRIYLNSGDVSLCGVCGARKNY